MNARPRTRRPRAQPQARPPPPPLVPRAAHGSLRSHVSCPQPGRRQEHDSGLARGTLTHRSGRSPPLPLPGAGHIHGPQQAAAGQGLPAVLLLHAGAGERARPGASAREGVRALRRSAARPPRGGATSWCAARRPPPRERNRGSPPPPLCAQAPAAVRRRRSDGAGRRGPSRPRAPEVAKGRGKGGAGAVTSPHGGAPPPLGGGVSAGPRAGAGLRVPGGSARRWGSGLSVAGGSCPVPGLGVRCEQTPQR